MAEKKERLIRISRRVGMPKWQEYLIKFGFIIFALLMCGIISTLVKPGSFLQYYEFSFMGTFYNPSFILNLLWETAFLFLIALAITPAFKMKFWNIGAEGQVLMGGFGALIAMKFIAPFVPGIVSLSLEFIFAVVFAAIWAFIPAIFKAYFNTNETLFTLMMNYIAMGIVAACCIFWSTSGSSTLGVINPDHREGWFSYVGGFENSYILNIIIVIIVAVILLIYLNYSKHGYEISVVGGSRNTAKYVGINVKNVMMRTMILSGLICGIAGFLFVAGSGHTLGVSSVGGKGFTAIMVSWLGGFSVPIMAIYAFLVSFISKGSANAAAWIGYSGTISNVLTGLFFIFIITSTFFVNFKIHIRWSKKRDNKMLENLE